MSDFVSRLVDRQMGAATMIQPRLPSMFAPPVSQAGAVDPPGIDAPSLNEEVTRKGVDASPPSDRHGEVRAHTARQPGLMMPGSQVMAPASGKPRHAESAPTPLVRNAPLGLSRPAGETPVVVREGSLRPLEPTSRAQLEITGRATDDRADSAPVLPAPRMDLPPRLVEAHHETRRSPAPPSLISGVVSRRKVDQDHAGSQEPPVEVTIGRIEVTAVSAAADQKRKPASRRPAMSLEDYLTRRQGGAL